MRSFAVHSERGRENQKGQQETDRHSVCERLELRRKDGDDGSIKKQQDEPDQQHRKSIPLKVVEQLVFLCRWPENDLAAVAVDESRLANVSAKGSAKLYKPLSATQPQLGTCTEIAPITRKMPSNIRNIAISKVSVIAVAGIGNDHKSYDSIENARQDIKKETALEQRKLLKIRC